MKGEWQDKITNVAVFQVRVHCVGSGTGRAVVYVGGVCECATDYLVVTD